MGILNLKKNTAAVTTSAKTKKLAVTSAKEKKVPAVIGGDVSFDSHVLIRPRITEKASMLSAGDRPVVVFEVSKKATAKSVALAVKGLYKVSPVKVSILPIPAKRKFVRGRMTTGTTGNKAYVYLKTGDKIEIA